MVLAPRLKKAKALVDEWAVLRDRLTVLDYSRAVKLIDSCLSRIYSHMHERSWPPIWWRFMTIDAALDDMKRYFFRMDAEGMFFGDGPDGYALERDEIIGTVRRLASLATNENPR